MATFYIEQFGCRATQADGAAIERQLLERGCTPASSARAADFVIVNTCTVTAAADSQARDSIRKIHLRNRDARVIVTGCYAQRAPEELAALPGVSWVVGNSHKHQIPELLRAASLRAEVPLGSKDFFPANALGAGPFSPESLSLAQAPAKILTGDIFAQTSFLAASVLGGEGNHTRPVLKIQDGCNSRCSYCVIPFVRGKSRSLPPDQVVEEIRRLSEAGFREIVLSGINLGTYGRDLSPRVEFIGLLRTILNVGTSASLNGSGGTSLNKTGFERLRISSIEPLDVTQDLIALFASTDRIAQHFHMPLQSGSDRILAAMHRWYRTEHYARRVELIREHLPNAAIGADVIAGFPGETPADHDATLDFIQRLPFSYLHVFSFSQRPGTRAATLPDQVPEPAIKERARQLRSLGESKAREFRRAQIGRTLKVLTLHPDRNCPAGSTPALSTNYLRVRVKGQFASNCSLDVVLENEEGNWLVGVPTR